MKRIKINLIPVMLLLTMLLLGSEIVSYHQLAHAKSAEHGQSVEHGDSHGEHGAEHHGPPVIYFIYWVLLLACLYRAGVFLKAHKDEVDAHNAVNINELGLQEEAGEANHGHDTHHDDHGGHDDHGHHPEPTALDKSLVVMVLLMFVFEQVPSLAHYHELNALGFVKFLLKATLGVALMTYGILGMEEH